MPWHGPHTGGGVRSEKGGQAFCVGDVPVNPQITNHKMFGGALFFQWAWMPSSKLKDFELGKEPEGADGKDKKGKVWGFGLHMLLHGRGQFQFAVRLSLSTSCVIPHSITGSADD